MNNNLNKSIEYLIEQGFTVIICKDLGPYSLIEQKSTATIWLTEDTLVDIVQSLYNKPLAKSNVEPISQEV